jgi:hypothetical protein
VLAGEAASTVTAAVAPPNGPRLSGPAGIEVDVTSFSSSGAQVRLSRSS